MCLRKATVVLLAVVVVGCATTETPGPDGADSVHIRSVPRPPEGLRFQAQRYFGAKDDLARNVLKDAAVGGAATGVACMVFVTALGADNATEICAYEFLLGAAFGASRGVARSVEMKSVIRRYPSNTTDELVALVKRAERDRDFFVAIRDGLRATATDLEQVDEADAMTLVSVGPRYLRLIQTEDLALAVRMTASLAAKRPGRRLEDKVKIVYTSPPRPIEEWLDDDGKAFEEALDNCVYESVRMMHAGLTQILTE